MKYVIEEYNHNNGAKTYAAFVIKESFFGLKIEKYPLCVQYVREHFKFGPKYEFFDLKEDAHYYPTSDLEYVKELIEHHKLWMERQEGSKIKNTKTIEVK